MGSMFRTCKSIFGDFFRAEIAAFFTVICLSGSAVGDALEAPRGASCGQPGKPPCPLQSWMRENVAKPLAAKDAEALATALERSVALNPEPAAWKEWDVIAREGAAAARAKNDDATLASCTRCHNAFRKPYLERYRERAVK
jgi:cytochrome c-type biogenesis protein CcmH/NrfG